MPLAPETVTFAGSGLVFENSYGAGVSDAFRAAIVVAENAFQSHFTDAVTVSMRFDLQPLDPSVSAHNSYALAPVTYAQFVAALAQHATTASDVMALQGLPETDPSGGQTFWLSAPQARVLGLAPALHGLDDLVVLNSTLGFSFGADVVGVLEHEISEGVFGRVGSLGRAAPGWQPMDLFRFDAQGQRDFTGGADGAPTFFGLDGAHLSDLQFHNAIGAGGGEDGFDLADWDHTFGDAFGPGGPGSAGQMSATDLQILDILGWTPAQTSTSHGQVADFEPLQMIRHEVSLFGGPLFEP